MQRWFRMLAVLGMAFDFLVGILLHFTISATASASRARIPGLIKQCN